MSYRLMLIIALSLIVLLGARGVTLASWTSAGDLPGTTLHTGRLDISVDGVDGITDFAPLDLVGLVPGGSTAAVLTVKNSGNVPLAYTASTAGSSSDGHGLVGALVVKVTAADVVTGASCGGTSLAGSAATVGGPLITTARTLAPGATERVCVQVGLPEGAPASVAASTADLTITVATQLGGWSDDVAVAGTHLQTPTLRAPTLTCAPSLPSGATLSWSAVPGATGYLVHSGLLGDTLDLVPSSTLSKTVLVSSLVSVQAVFGSRDWASPGSNALTYSVLTGRCS